MKHPALVSVLAVALAVVSLLTLLSGAICTGKAVKDNNENSRQLEILSDKTEKASLLLRKAEEDRGAFESTDASLTGLRGQYGTELSEYRKTLSEHTATRAGLVMGRSALGAAYGAINSGREQLEQGRAAYEEGAAAFDQVYQQYLTGKEGLEKGWEAYNEAVKQLEANSAELEEKRKQVETMLTAISATKQTIAGLKELISGLEEQMPADQAGSQKMMIWVMTFMSIYFCAIYNSAFALYWVVSNIYAIVEQVPFNKYFEQQDRKSARAQEVGI